MIDTQTMTGATLTSKSIRQALDAVPVLANVHDRNARYLAYPSLKVPITRGNDVAFVLRHSVHDTIVCIGTLV